MNLVVNGILLSYQETGEPNSPTILMLHGWGASSQCFDGLAAALSSQFRVVSLDLPGFGGSQLPPANWHIRDYATLVQAFVAKAQLGRLHSVVGHSFGGRVAIKGVGEGLLKPRKLVLMGSAGVRHSTSLRNRLFMIIAKLGKLVTSLPGLSRLRARLRRRLYQAAGSTDYLSAGPLQQVLINTVNEDLQADAAAIAIPALLIWGDLDVETPVADGQLLASKIPHSRLQVIDHAGHFVFLDAPDAVARQVVEFLA